MTTQQSAVVLTEDFAIANIIARLFIDSGKPYTFSNVISRCYSTAFNFARERLVARGIEVDGVNGMEIADELTHDFLAMANTIVRKHYATR